MRLDYLRRALLAADLVLGLVLLAVAFRDALPTPNGAPGPSPQPPVEVTARLGPLWPGGQAAGLAVDPAGGLAIIDRTRQRIVRLDPAGRPLTEWGPRFGASLFADDMVGIAPDRDGWYVLDRGALHILRLGPTGVADLERTIDLAPLSTYGPNAIAADGTGNLYVADTGRDRVLVFDPDGRMVRSIGDSGSGVGRFKQPMALAFGVDGAMFVSDWENARVQRFDAALQATDAWSVPDGAWGIAVDPLGRVFVPDTDARLVRLFGPTGQTLAEIGPLPLEAPGPVAVTPDGSALWVLGRDGLARVDLAVLSDVRAANAIAAPARVPLAVLGVALLALAATGAVVKPRAPPRIGKRVVVAPPEPRQAEPAPAHTSVSPLLLAGGGLFVLGALVAAHAGLRLTEPLASSEPWPRLLQLFSGGVIWAVGMALISRGVRLEWMMRPRSTGPTPARLELKNLAWVGTSGACAVVAAVIWWQYRFLSPEATRAALVWLGAVALLGWLCLGNVRTPPLPRAWLVPIALFVLALVPRLWDVGGVPYGLWYDEAQGGLEARTYLDHGRYTPISNLYGRDPALLLQLVAAASLVIPDPIVALRGVAGSIGALNAPLLYVLGRELFGWRTGLAAGVLVATSRWHLDMSRLGMASILMPVCATLAFWLLARAVRTGRWTDATWAGMAFGLGLHGYAGFRVIPLVGLATLIYAAWRERWLPWSTAGRLAVIMAAATLVALPVLVFAVQDPVGFNGRVAQTLIFNQPRSQSEQLAELWSNVQAHARMFHVSGDMNGRHNIPGWPMLDPVVGVLVVLGLAWTLIHVLDWRSALLVVWGAVSMTGGILTLAFEAPQAVRTLGVVPVLALLSGLALVLALDGACALGTLLNARWASRLRTLGAAAGALVLVGVSVVGLDTYFRVQMSDPRVWEAFSARETVLARMAEAHGAAYEVILGSATIAPSPQASLLAPQWRDKIRTFDAIADLPYTNGGPAVILLETEHDSALAEEVARRYPAAARRAIGAPGGRSVVEEVLLDPTVLDGQRGLAAVYVGADGTRVERREGVASVSAGDAPVALPARVEWRGGLVIDQAGMYRFQTSDGFVLSLDGAAIPSHARVDLARGTHAFTLSGVLNGGGQVQVSWQAAGTDQWRPLDQRALFQLPDGGYGLEATFYPSPNWQGSPALRVIDPLLAHYYHLSPFGRLAVDVRAGWSVEWVGYLEAPATGQYYFEVERISRAGVWIDEQVVLDDTPPGAAEARTGTIELAAGFHSVRVRLQNRADGGPRLYLYWTPPGAAREIVPGRALYPPRPRPQ